MPQKHELEIEIRPDGQIQVHVKGAKGKQCMEYVQVFASLGKVVEQETTSEYYEPDSSVSVTDHTQSRIRF